MSYRKNIVVGLLFLFTSSFLFEACKKEVIFSDTKPELILTQSDTRFKLSLIKLDADTVYRVSADIAIEAGKTLLIEAGTLLRMDRSVGITIESGGIIEAVGTKDLPVVFTSSAFKGGAGSNVYSPPTAWKGIRILGSSTSGSGTLKYVRVEFAGQANYYTASIEFNNLSPATILENIQVSYSLGAPSFAFNGGNCNASNLVSYACFGSDFYMYNGYKGKSQNLLAYRHPYYPATLLFVLAGFQIEDAATEPVISNVTVLGPDNQPGTTAIYKDSLNYAVRTSIVIRNAARFHIRNSVFMGFPVGGLFIDSRESAIELANGKSEMAYSTIHCNDSSKLFILPGNLFPGVGNNDLKTLLTRDSLKNKIFIQGSEFMFTDPYSYDLRPDPQPKPSSPLLVGANYDHPLFNDPFFKKTSHTGAIGSENWLEGWTNFIPLQTDYNN